MTFQLMIHGGAGAVNQKQDYFQSTFKVLTEGRSRLEQGMSALDVVEFCVVMLEDDAAYNAGRGSVLNAKGQIEMDAAIMNGLDLNAGSVAGVQFVRNPVRLARLVMEKSEHVMLVGEGACEFGRLHQIEFESSDYFVTEKRKNQWLDAQQCDKVYIDHIPVDAVERKLGTVGAVARDVHGNLAAATSTGGLVNKKFGRIGDSPIIGAGVFADNETCAVSATGYGEQFIRTTMGKTVSEFVRYKGMTAQQAADEAISYLVKKVQGVGGIIVVDKQGNWGSSFSSSEMIHGRADSQGVVVLT
jgi:beta-aspartyl-peptidase (threonine type)